MFNDAPIFNSPQDSNLDNIYVLTIAASDGFSSISNVLTIIILPYNTRHYISEQFYTQRHYTQLLSLKIHPRNTMKNIDKTFYLLSLLFPLLLLPACDISTKSAENDTEIVNTYTQSSTDIIIDTQIDDLKFSSITDAPLNTLIESNILTISGINEPTNISITGGEYKINANAYSSSNSTVQNGDIIQFRLLTHNVWGKEHISTVIIGSKSFDFIVLTHLQDISPQDFQFTPVNDANTETIYESNTIVVSEITGSVSINISGGEYKVNNGNFLSEQSFIENGQSITLRGISSQFYSVTSTIEVVIGDKSATYLITTKQDSIPIESDLDNDGIPDDLDAFPNDPTEWIDTDGDGYGDNSDLDADGNGILDSEEISSPPTWEEPVIYTDLNSINVRVKDIIQQVDMDNDGDIDLVTVSYLDNSLEWHENNGTNTFDTHRIYNQDLLINSVTITDIDGDNDQDIIGISRVQGEIILFENNSEQIFTQHIIDNTESNYIIAVDLDNDKHMDFVTWETSRSGTSAKWYKNDGAQQFSSQNIFSGFANLKLISVIDIDKDDDLDFLISSSRWMENNGDQTFTTRNIANQLASDTVIGIDLDKDDDIDLVSISYSDDRVAWHENDGAQNFTQHTISTNEDGVVDLQVFDFDSDGDLDLLTASKLDNKISWFENKNQAFINHEIIKDLSYLDFLLATDIDNDGDHDILISNSDNHIIWYDFIGYDYKVIEGDLYVTTIKATDIDSNHLTYQIKDELDSQLFEIHPATGELKFKFASTLNDSLVASQNTYTLNVSASDEDTTIYKTVKVIILPNDQDDDNDGILDTLDDFPLDSKQWLDSDGDGIGNNIDTDDDNDSILDINDNAPINSNSSQAPFWNTQEQENTIVHITSTTDGYLSLASSDIDGDGDMDLLTNSTELRQLVLFENNGNEFFNESYINKDNAGSLEATEIIVQDINNDEQLDVITLSADNSRITVFSKITSSLFYPYTISLFDEDAFDIELVDLDNDGDIDIISSTENDNVVWYENIGSFSFIEHQISSTFNSFSKINNVKSIKSGDLDADGDIDILFTSELRNTIYLLENMGDQIFRQVLITTTVQGVNSIEISDIDKDGDLDFFSASSKDNTVAWYENSGNLIFSKHVISDALNGVYFIDAVDIDHDGDDDVLVNLDSNTITFIWLENLANKTFHTHTVNQSSTGADLIIASDINSDGDIDILSVSQNDESISWHKLTDKRYQIIEGERSVATELATDTDGNIITYLITGGPDAPLFNIDSQSGEITFKIAPSYDDPQDFNSDNIYSITISANDGYSNSINRMIEIEVQTL
ncbi:FG-GAP-like repeat-containing protein [Marinicellulosiphila megalodicopiae]|uniref:FG-GAP-like repeat-containing protein n=1 Tax=Marinicellulosiphila megalodicopiae TaxID=2724896 RepID=UPI003BB05876